MGNFKGAAIVEQRIYDDPQNPETSDYHVGLPITTTNAVFNPDTGKSLDETLQQIESGSGGVGAATDAEDIKQTAVTGPDGEELTVNEALAVLSGKIGDEENVGEALETIRASLSNNAKEAAAAIVAHGIDRTTHPDIHAGQAIHDNRLQLLENTVFSSDIQDNRTPVYFASLDSVELVRGNYNAVLQRIEC